MNSLEQDKYLNGSATAREQGDVWISLINLLIAEVCKEVRATMGPSRWWRSAYDRVQASGATGLPFLPTNFGGRCHL